MDPRTHPCSRLELLLVGFCRVATKLVLEKIVQTALRHRGFTRQLENSKRARLRVGALQTPPKFHEKTPRERKRAKMGALTLRVPPFGPQTGFRFWGEGVETSVGGSMEFRQSLYSVLVRGHANENEESW